MINVLLFLYNNTESQYASFTNFRSDNIQNFLVQIAIDMMMTFRLTCDYSAHAIISTDKNAIII